MYLPSANEGFGPAEVGFPGFGGTEAQPVASASGFDPFASGPRPLGDASNRGGAHPPSGDPSRKARPAMNDEGRRERERSENVAWLLSERQLGIFPRRNLTQ